MTLGNAPHESSTGDDVIGRDKIDQSSRVGNVSGKAIAIGDGGTVNATIVEAPPSPAPAALHQLRPACADFTGREAELAAWLAAEEKDGVLIIWVQGMGGVGKTELALKLAEALTPRYPDAQLFVELHGAGLNPLTPAEALARVIRAFHPEARLPESEADLRGLYYSVLNGKRVLLLMDDARDDAQVPGLIPPRGCGLLITSRQHFHLPGLHTQDLDCLPPVDAEALLLTIAPRIGADCAAEIAQLCGRLPLALRLVGSMLAATPDLSPEHYARKLRDARKHLEVLGSEGVGRKFEASFNLSYAHLPTEAARVVRKLSVFPATFDAAAAEAVCADDGHEHVSQLVKSGLVEWDDAADRYRLYDLARWYGDRRGEGTDLGNMCVALDELGQRVDAIAHAEAAPDIYQQIEDPNAAMVHKKLKA